MTAEAEIVHAPTLSFARGARVRPPVVVRPRSAWGAGVVHVPEVHLVVTAYVASVYRRLSTCVVP